MVEFLEALNDFTSSALNSFVEQLQSVQDEHPYLPERIYQLKKKLESKNYSIA
jgi:acyl carrier protein phosphodiesterase